MTRLLRFHDDLVQKGKFWRLCLDLYVGFEAGGKMCIKASWRNKINSVAAASSLAEPEICGWC
jgi:hypothetical protein